MCMKTNNPYALIKKTQIIMSAPVLKGRMVALMEVFHSSSLGYTSSFAQLQALEKHPPAASQRKCVCMALRRRVGTRMCGHKDSELDNCNLIQKITAGLKQFCICWGPMFLL